MGRSLLAVECGSRRVPFVVTFEGVAAELVGVAALSNTRSASLRSMACSHPQWAAFAWALLPAGGGSALRQGSTNASTAQLSLQGVPDGQYSVQVRCVDAAERVLTHVWTSHSFVLDYSAPLPEFTDKPVALSAVQAPNFTLAALDQLGVVSHLQYSLCPGGCAPGGALTWVLACASASASAATVAAAANAPPCSCSSVLVLDNGTSLNRSSCSTVVSMGALSDGDYTLALLAADLLGRNTTVHYSWRVDTVAPVPLVVGRPPPFTNSTTARFSFSCSDGEGECGYEYLLLNPQLGAGPGSVWTSLLLPVVDPFLAVTETVASLVTWVRAVGGRRVVVTPNVTLSLATASTLSTAVQFEYSVCHQSCGPAHLLPWSTLPPGESALSLNLPDGEYVMLTRVAGLSVLGSAHPAASVRFSMEAEAPVTYIKGCERDGSARDVTITVGLMYPSSLPLALASAVWYSLDGTPWQFRNHTSTLKLKVGFICFRVICSFMSFWLGSYVGAAARSSYPTFGWSGSSWETDCSQASGQILDNRSNY